VTIDRARLGRLAFAIVVAIGLSLVVLGVRASRTGRDATNLPEAIEQISPADGDRVLRQSQIIVDFAPGYEAELLVDGILLPTTRLDELTSGGAAPAPGAQVELPPTAVWDPGNATISFQPQVGAVIEELAQGEHVGVVRYWRATDDRPRVRSYTWRFRTD
jgi:hypothetical protein